LIHIFDNFLNNFDERLEYAKSADYSLTEYQGVNYKNIHVLENDQAIIDEINKVSGLDLEGWSILRTGHNPTGWIHADTNCGGWAAVYYLTEPEDIEGTAFWSHKGSGDRIASNDWVDIVNNDANNEDAWNLKQIVVAKKNRLVLFPCDIFHSVYPRVGPESRIVQVVFLNRKK